jgi:hypothetical protein
MRRVRAGKRGRWISLLAAGLVGYLLGGWHAANNRSTELTAAQSVALRFPEASAGTAIERSATEMPTGTVSATALKEVRLALLSPQPMAPIASALLAQPQAVAPPPMPQEPPATAANQAASAPKPEAAAPRGEPKASANSAAAHHAGRPGFLLNDAQIASIKERLHLTRDQERMWPAVEAALRNIAYAKAHYARRHGAPESTQTAALDVDSAEVQGLKSAAIPLLMSFSDEQKNEVRSLAHVMGLDQLAAEF